MTIKNSLKSEIDGAIAIVASHAAHDDNQYWHSLAIALRSAFKARLILISTRTDDGQHQPRQMVGIGERVAPDGSRPQTGSFLVSRPLPGLIPISSTDTHHRSMHSVAAHQSLPVLVVRDNVDPIIREIDRDVRNEDEWSSKASYFISWGDRADVPKLIVSFGIPLRHANLIDALIDTDEWRTLYDLIDYRVNEIYPDPLEQIPTRELHSLQAEADYGYDENKILEILKLKSIRTHRRRLARIGIGKPRAYAIWRNIIRTDSDT
jgi:hypothetical protein